ncbi:MAG: Flp pilus assembly complex ATPase component TadA [Candidatus Omnitrophica bacterium]|nr:Flp pilus assembly complex ATPase component TadA [Candidatus Omnitrophota bacterium]
MASFDKVKELGDLLVENNVISLEALDKAFEIQANSKDQESLREILIREFKIPEEDIVQYGLAKQYGVKYVDLRNYEEFDEDLLLSIELHFVEKFQVFPFKKEKGVLEVAMINPKNIVALDELEIKTELKIEPLMTCLESFSSAVSKFYKKQVKKEELSQVMQALDEKYSPTVESVDLKEGADEDSAPIIKLSNNIIEEAYKKGASDIHIEPFEKTLRIRYRTDGVCYEAFQVPKHSQNALISRFKIMSELNIAEKRLPQDGRIQFKQFTKGRIDIDLRVNTAPLVYGEKICMRILDKTATAVGLDQLGFNDHNFEVYSSIIEKPYGMILHVGPTGSGKTTTLYSALNAINKPEVNIQTAEDPVEYMLQGINQLPVKADIGLTFASALRAFLRQDPDVLMLGEIRDTETAEIAVEAALTGHLMISTLHTNDAAGTVSRLIDMEIEPFLLSSALLGVCAQRLLRRVCANCKKEYKLTAKELKEMEVTYKFEKDPTTFSKGEGCSVCSGTGYKGRLGIHEILTLNDELKTLIMKKATASEIKEAAIRGGMISIFEDGMLKAAQGLTTLEEVLRVTRED